MQNSLEHTELNLLLVSRCVFASTSFPHACISHTYAHTKLLVSRSSEWNSAEKYFSLSWQLLTCGRQPARVSLPPLSPPLLSCFYLLWAESLSFSASRILSLSHRSRFNLYSKIYIWRGVNRPFKVRFAPLRLQFCSLLHKLPDTPTVLQPNKRQQPNERTWAAFMEHLLLLNCHVSSNQVKRANKVFVYRGFLQLAWNSTKQSLWALGVCIQNF